MQGDVAEKVSAMRYFLSYHLQRGFFSDAHKDMHKKKFGVVINVKVKKGRLGSVLYRTIFIHLGKERIIIVIYIFLLYMYIKAILFYPPYMCGNNTIYAPLAYFI